MLYDCVKVIDERNGYYNYNTLGGIHLIAENNSHYEQRCYGRFEEEALFYEIDSETRGQYIGIKDKDGKEI